MNNNRHTCAGLLAATPAAPRLRRHLLATASLLALSGAMAPGAMAQSSSYSYTFGVLAAVFPAPPVQTRTATGYMDTVNSGQGNTANQTATATGINVSITATSSSAGVPTPGTTTNNTTQAIAAGNQASNFIDPVLLVNPAGAGPEGQGIISGQVHGGLNAGTDADGVSVRASVDGRTHITETLIPAAPLVLSGNTLAARSTLNSVDSRIGLDSSPAPGVALSGAIPPGGYTSAVTGAATITTNATTTAGTAAGSISINNAQTAYNGSSRAGSAATVTNSDVTLNLSQSTTDLTAPLTVTNNTLEAAFQGNQATGIVKSEAGSGQLTGSTVVTNAQSNVENIAGALGTTAGISGSEVAVNIRDQAASFTDLTSSLTVAGNRISATSGGNAAGDRSATGSVLAGNAIVYATGAAVTGTGSATNNSLTSTAAGQSATATGDLLVISSQQNGNTGVNSSVTTGVVTITADRTTATGSVNANENTVESGATGNLAGNLISVDSYSGFTGSAGGGNAQINNNNTITATNAGGAVTVNVGTALAADVRGTINATDNTVRASADGNVGATTVQVQATNLSALGSAAGSSAVATIATGNSTVVSGISANNVQTNLTAPITSSVTDGAVQINITDLASSRVLVVNGNLAANGNTISSAAGGNTTAGTSASVSGTDGTVQASVGSLQVNQSAVSGTVSGASGVVSTTGGLTNSNLTANDNTVSAAATGNTGSNATRADFGNRLTVGPNAMTGGVNLTTDGTAATSTAALGLASVQSNTASIVSSNITTNAFALIRSGETGVAPITDSELTVQNNTGTSVTTGNSANNQVSINATTIETTGNAATKIGGLNNVQTNSGAAGTATTGASDAVGLLLGVEFQQQLSNANVSVNTNTVVSSVRGNQASNSMAVTGGTLNPAASTATSGQSTSSGIAVGAVTTVQGEFGLINRQIDTGATSRNAIVQNGLVGVQASGALTASGIVNSAITVEGNDLAADARSNNAASALTLEGFSSLNTTANLLSQQYGVAPVSATVGADVQIAGPVANTDVEGSDLTVKGNQANALAAGSIASNTLSAKSTNLDGNALIAANAGGSAGTVGGALTTNADFSVVNRQSQQTGALASTANASMRIDLTGSDIETGTATVVDNNTSAVAQATSASNTLKLTGTNESVLTAAVASTQVTDSAITATQTAGAYSYSFGVIALTSAGAPITVSGNAVVVSAGKNEAVNEQAVTATNLSGGAAGNGTTSYDTAGGTAQSGADFSVLNLQSGTTGAVTATSTPGMTGANVATSITGGNATVSDNSDSVTAKVNSSTNELTLNGTNNTNASGAVASVQSASGTVSASQVSSGLGMTFGVITTTADGTPITVSGNSVNVSASQNEASNSLKVEGTNVTGATAGGGGAAFTPGGTASASAAYSVLNVQSGSGNVTATANPGLIGGRVDTINGASISVNDNTVAARANVNQATNTLDLNASSSLNATGAINNVQTTSAGFNVTSQVGNTTPTTIGVIDNGGTAFNNTVVTVDGNRISAQSGGNTASSTLNAVAGSAISGSPGTTYQVLNYQSNLSGMSASVTNSQIGIPNNGGGSQTGTVSSILGNQVLSYGYGNSATNTIGVSSMAGGMNQASTLINNSQYNGGNISATISGVSAGSVGGSISGGSVVVSNNTITAQAVGNVAVNRITAK